MKKLHKLKTTLFKHKFIIPFLVVLMTLLISIGYATFGQNLLIGDMVATVRVEKDIRISGVKEVIENYEPTLGDEFICNVDGTNEYHFYLLSEQEENINLIMNNNLISNSYWLTESDYVKAGGNSTEYGDYGNTSKGPITAMNALYEATKNWNVPNIVVNYQDGIQSHHWYNSKAYYTGITTVGTTTTIKDLSGNSTASYENLKARLPMGSELYDANCKSSSCPDWLLVNTTSYNGYWTLSTSSSSEAQMLWNSSSDAVYYDNISYATSGIRPVISIPKTSIGTTCKSVKASTSYIDYNVSNIYGNITLPTSDSSVTLNVEITNIGNAEAGILDITGLPDNLDYELLDYKLKEKICDSNNKCSLGIRKEIQIKIKYKDGGYDSSNTTYDISLDFDFQPIYKIEYKDINIPVAIDSMCSPVTKATVGNVPAGNYTPGDEYICNVDGTNEYHFFVLSTDGDNVNLIMNNNLISSSYWLTESDYVKAGGNSTEYGDYGNTSKGPITAMNALYEATKNWNVPNIVVNYQDGIQSHHWYNSKAYYTGITTVGTTTTIKDLSGNSTASYENLKARLPMGSELYDANCKSSSCPDWLLVNTTSYNGYWTLSTSSSSEAQMLWNTTYDAVYYYYISYATSGIRPVITFAKTSDFPSEVIGGDTLEIDFENNAPEAIKVLIDSVETTDYTYENGVLTISGVSGNVEIIKDEQQVALAQYITDLYNNSTTKTNSLAVDGITYSLDTTNQLMDDRLGGTVSSGGNIRYYGATPNNYIDIGDRDSSGKVILWRIIGVFKDVQMTDTNGNVTGTEDLVKIIRNDFIGNYFWDYTSSGSYDNNWSDSTLKTMLNGAYYNSSTTSYYNNSTTATNVDFTSIGLSPNAQSKVQSVVWNLGGISSSTSDSNYYPNLYSEGYYKWERGTTVYSGRPTTWPGKIALMYPSDYGYATDFTKCSQKLYNYNSSTDSYACRTNDWLYKSSSNQWTITPDSSSSPSVLRVYSTGIVVSSLASNTSYGVRPVLYLKSDISIVGEGTTSDGIKYYVVE